MRKLRFLFCLFFLLCFVVPKAHAYIKLFDSENYSAQNYLEVGNHYAKNNQLGLAIYSYEEGLKNYPFNKELKHNLELIQLNYGLDYKIKNGLNWKIVDNTVFITLLLVLMLSLIYFLRQSQFVNLKFLSLKGMKFLFAVTCLIFIVSTLLWYNKENEKQGIIIAKNVIGKIGPNADANSIFEFKEGEKVIVFKTYLSWVKVQNNYGDMVWVYNQDIKVL